MTVGGVGPVRPGRPSAAPSAAPASAGPATLTAAPASNDDAYNEEHDNTNPTADGPPGSVASVAGRVHAAAGTGPRCHVPTPSIKGPGPNEVVGGQQKRQMDN